MAFEITGLCAPLHLMGVCACTERLLWHRAHPVARGIPSPPTGRTHHATHPVCSTPAYIGPWAILTKAPASLRQFASDGWPVAGRGLA